MVFYKAPGVAGIQFPADNYMFKVNNGNTRKRCEICSDLAIKTPEQRHRRRFSVFIVNFEHISYLVPVFIVNFEHISHLVLVFILLTLIMQMPAGFLSLCADLMEMLLVLRYRSEISLQILSELIPLTPEIIRKHGFLMT